VAEVLKLVLGVTLLLEAITAAALTLRLALGYDMAWDAALWHGLFHAVSAFNQAGFSTWSDSLVGFQTDILVLGPVMAAVLVSGLGFPVLHELRRELRTPKSWSVHTKITLFGSGLLLAVGSVALTAYEWNNPATLGPMGAGPKLLNGLFHSVMPRSAGLNTIDVGQLRSESLVMNHFLMLVGGGSASTAGGIKVTTFFLLGYVVWAQVRGEPDVTAFGRRISSDVQREALTVVLLSISFVAAATLCLLSLTDFSLEDVLFETISAFATVGLSTGITSRLPPTGQVLLVALMFVGRVGTITVAAALAMRRRGRPFRYPEERPIVG
jgi:Trk-type K+ transport system membrane component